MSLPPSTLRLFPHYDEADLSGPAGDSLVIARLLEDGDATDLAWLRGRFTEPELAAWLARHGGRLLSNRSRAFWEDVLGTTAGPAAPGANDLWPL